MQYTLTFNIPDEDIGQTAINGLAQKEGQNALDYMKNVAPDLIADHFRGVARSKTIQSQEDQQQKALEAEIAKYMRG